MTRIGVDVSLNERNLAFLQQLISNFS